MRSCLSSLLVGGDLRVGRVLYRELIFQLQQDFFLEWWAIIRLLGCVTSASRQSSELMTISLVCFLDLFFGKKRQGLPVPTDMIFPLQIKVAKMFPPVPP